MGEVRVLGRVFADGTIELPRIRTGIDSMVKCLGVELGDYQLKFGVLADESGKNMYDDHIVVFLGETKEFLVNKELFEKIAAVHERGIETAIVGVARAAAMILEAYSMGSMVHDRAMFMSLDHGLEYVGKSRAAQTLLAVIGASAMVDPDGANWDEVPVRMLSHLLVHDKIRTDEIQKGFMGEETLAQNVALASHMFGEKKNFISYSLYYTSLMPKLGDSGTDEEKKDCFRDLLGDIIATVMLVDHTKQQTESFVKGFYRDITEFKRMSEKGLPRIRRRSTSEVEELRQEEDVARDN